MMRVVADTRFYLAALNARDASHKNAVRLQQSDTFTEIVTKSWVLVELADSMHLPRERRIAARFITQLSGTSRTEVVPASEELLQRGLDLYRRRPDKDRSLTDCLSFVVMSEASITDALTGDRHFEQAGFRALLAQ